MASPCRLGDMEPGTSRPHLPIGAYRLEFAADNPVILGEFPGSAWRGAFGHALKRAVCVTRERRCESCLLYRTCLYPYVFQTPPPPDAAKMRRYEAVPHPFALRPEPAPGDDGRVSLLLTLFGDANRHLAAILYALMRAASGERGIAGNRLMLRRVCQEEAPGSSAWIKIYEEGGVLAPLPPLPVPVPPVPPAITIHLHTPLRIKRDGRHVGAAEFRFSDLFRNLLRRISMLTYFHTDTPLETDFKALVTHAETIATRSELAWKDWTRYSARQKTLMRLGGLVGRIDIDGQDLAPFWPYLWLGQWTHAGAGATMGLGHYTLASLQVAREVKISATLSGDERT